MMKILRIALLVCLSVAVLWGEGGLASAEGPSYTVDFGDTVYFSSPDGSDVVVNQGTYDVEFAETWLRVIPHEGTRADVLLIEARELVHQDNSDRPQATVTVEENGMVQLVLLLPGGKGLHAMGYRGGILSRAVPRTTGGPALQGSSQPKLNPSPVPTQPKPQDPAPWLQGPQTALEKWLFLEVQDLKKTVVQLKGQLDLLQGKYANHQQAYVDTNLVFGQNFTVSGLRSYLQNDSHNLDQYQMFVYPPDVIKNIGNTHNKITDKPKN